MRRFVRSIAFAGTLAIVACIAVPGSVQGADVGISVLVPRSSRPVKLVTLTFEQADIIEVLQFLADASGKTAFNSIDTTITIRSRTPMPVNKAIGVVKTLVALKGYALTDTPDLLIVHHTKGPPICQLKRPSAPPIDASRNETHKP